MPEKLKELLEKINEEGIKQAEETRKAIETNAKAEAEKIIKDAKLEAERFLKNAKLEAQKAKEAGEIALKHASRDLILSLKSEIRSILERIVTHETGKAISYEELASILGKLIENYIEKKGESSDIKVLLKKEDLERIRNTFISKLKDKIKEGMEFKPSQNIAGGFSISFDKGKSFFDFTDESLKDALCAYLNPELAKLLKE